MAQIKINGARADERTLPTKDDDFERQQYRKGRKKKKRAHRLKRRRKKNVHGTDDGIIEDTTSCVEMIKKNASIKILFENANNMQK